jgi:ABC-2 type transport system ATP-binding protein
VHVTDAAKRLEDSMAMTVTREPAVPPASGTVAALRCRGLRKRFGPRQAVDGIGFEIAPGETYGLLGPNGAGKTTTISMICGILARDEGEVFVAGEPLDVGSTHAKRLVGLVPQELAIYPDLSARENLDYFGRLYGMHGKELRSRIGAVLEVVELTDRDRERTAGYSGGMKRRLNIAIGLLHGPRLLVLDEPTVGVDPQSRNAILASVESLGREGIGILYTTHYMEEADRLCDRVGIVDEGRIVAEGTRAELVRLVGETARVSMDAVGNIGEAAEALRRCSGVQEATAREGGLDVIVPEAATLLPELLAEATSAGLVVRSVKVVEPDLEAVFLHLTGKALRD